MSIPVLRTVADLRTAIAGLRAGNARVGLVPTMGALHAGHLALISAAIANGQHPVVTIFVNPTQFGLNEDFSAYPRDEATDVGAAASAGAVAVFAPPAGEVYPAGFTTSVQVGGLSDTLCGPLRPGHFAGMATVVTKLLLMSLPNSAYFGEKDFQQLQIVRRLARDLDIPVDIVSVKTVREPDGLALSSRNIYLSGSDRKRAPGLHAALTAAAGAIARGVCSADVREAAILRLQQSGFEPIDYFEVRDAETLTPVINVKRPLRVLAAAYLGRTRLIDNVAVSPAKRSS